MSNKAKFVVALLVLLVMAMSVSRQLFLFVEGNSSGLSTVAGRSHLLLAATAGVIACIAGGLMFLFFSRHEKNKWSKVEMTPTGPLLNHAPVNPRNWPAPLDPLRWALANPWLAEGQPDDRTPMDGSVTDSGQTPSGQRSFARRTHQLMFKKWSQARHD